MYAVTRVFIGHVKSLLNNENVLCGMSNVEQQNKSGSSLLHRQVHLSFLIQFVFNSSFRKIFLLRKIIR